MGSEGGSVRAEEPYGNSAAEGAAALSASGYPWISQERHAFNPPTPAPPPPREPQPIHLQIGRWGNVLAVRLPQALSRLLHLQRGDSFQLQLLSSGELLLTPRTPRSRIALADHLQRLLEQDRRGTP